MSAHCLPRAAAGGVRQRCSSSSFGAPVVRSVAAAAGRHPAQRCGLCRRRACTMITEAAGLQMIALLRRAAASPQHCPQPNDADTLPPAFCHPHPIPSNAKPRQQAPQLAGGRHSCPQISRWVRVLSCFTSRAARRPAAVGPRPACPFSNPKSHTFRLGWDSLRGHFWRRLPFKQPLK